MYSQTKPVTAAVLMTLFEDGAFMLDEPSSKWLPGVREPEGAVACHRPRSACAFRTVAAGAVEAARREITIFDLLTMTSGVAVDVAYARHWPTFRAAWEGTGFAPGDTQFQRSHQLTTTTLVVALAA